MNLRLPRLPRPMVLPAILLGGLILLLLAAPLLTSADPTAISVRDRMAAPSWAHPLGQDEFGRDRLARVLYGGRVSLTVAFLASTIASLVGTLFGLVGAYFRGPFEFLTMRLSDVVLCFPPILLALLVVTLFGPGVPTLVAVLSVLYFPSFARIAYSEALRVAALDFVEASRALGTPPRRILFRTVLPNVLGPLSVQYSLTAAGAITIESGLSFLGLGVVPPAPSWGQMIRGARAFMTQDPLGILVPCAALTLTIYAINIFCDRAARHARPEGWRRRQGRHRRPLRPLRRSRRRLRPGVVAEIDGAAPGPARRRSGPVALIDDVSLTLRRNECTALVGESGSGKSLTALALMGLLPDAVHRLRAHPGRPQGAGATADLAALPAARGGGAPRQRRRR